jgi:hypothetical protein
MMLTFLTHLFAFVLGAAVGVYGGYKWGARTIGAIKVAEEAVKKG